jgi:peptidoglycan/xylan/chitin deacetylase (PgdA/CDA1 family)
MKSRLRTLRPLFVVAALIAALIAPASATGTSVKQVALTFDDGDNERHIRQAVAVAVATQTPITFFPTGKSLNRFPNLWKAIGDAGIPIANHTMTHPDLRARYVAKGATNVKAELQGFINLARKLKIPVVPYWRPPGGSWDANVLRVAKSLGLTLTMWTNTFADTAPMCATNKKTGRRYLTPTWGSFFNATRTYSAGSSWWSKSSGGTKVNVLGHVNPYTAQTVKLLAAVITDYAGRGYQFVTVPEMATGTPNAINWAKAALAVSEPAKRPGDPRVPTSLPTPIDPLNKTYTFAQANGLTISCR